jgi:uncharacterized protein (TIGR03905 family)
MTRYVFENKGTCSRAILLDVDGDIINQVTFEGGCDGNLRGIGTLVAGQSARRISGMLAGNRCGGRATSCPDQLSQALKEVRAAEKGEETSSRLKRVE